MEIPEGFATKVDTTYYGHGKDASVMLTPVITFNGETVWEGEGRVVMLYASKYPNDRETVEMRVQLEAEDRLLNRLRHLFAD